MIADIHFLAVPGVCMANGHYLLRDTSFDMDDYLVETVENIKCTRDLDQLRTVPYFEDYDTVNLAVFEEADGKLTWYWVVSVTESTLKRESLDFNLSYCAPTDQYEAGDQIDGIFTRYPALVREYLKDVITDDALENEAYSKLATWWSAAPINWKTGRSSKTQLFWIEVTSTRNVITEDNSEMIRYGFPCIYDLNAPVFRAKSVKTNLTYNSQPVWFPELLDFLTNPERFMLPADSILNISISPICPYEYTFVTGATTPTITITMKDQNGATRGAVVFDDQGQPDYPGAVTKSYYGLVMLDAHDVVEDGNEYRTYPVSAAWANGTVSLSEVQRVCGAVSVCDQKAVPISNIPTELFVYDDTYEVHDLDYSYKVVSDFTGLYLHVRLNDIEDKVVVLPCGKLPWIGDAWEQYRYRQQATDREAAEYAKENARKEAMQGLVQAGVSMAAGGVAMGMGGGFGAAMGIQMMGQAVNEGLSAISNVENVTRSENQNLILTEHAMKNAAGTGYATAYGFGFVIECCTVGFGLMVQMPKNLDQGYFEDYVDEHGYPCEGKVSGIAMGGFYQGRILPSSTGIKAERLVDIFNAGLKFIVMPSNP